MRRPRRAAQTLRLTIEMLPRDTREAMLTGIEQNTIIAGAYTDRSGGVCPMLAAHRCGGRTNFGSFARAWDRFTDAGSRGRRATEREVLALRGYLESSLLRDEQEDKSIVELSAEIREARRLAAENDPLPASRVPGDRPAPGDAHRARELRHRDHWSWLRPLRRYDLFVEALAAAEEQVSEQKARQLSESREDRVRA